MTNRLIASGAVVLMAGILGAGPLWADEVSASVNDRIQKQLGIFVYPKGDQDATTQANDSLSCYNSAKERTGIDPEAPAAKAEAAPQARGGAVRGAARGAAGGAAMGAILDDTAKGAEVGALAGAVRGRRGQKKAAAQAQQAAEQSAEAANKQSTETFNRAFGACMDARNYSVQ